MAITVPPRGGQTFFNQQASQLNKPVGTPSAGAGSNVGVYSYHTPTMQMQSPGAMRPSGGGTPASIMDQFKPSQHLRSTPTASTPLGQMAMAARQAPRGGQQDPRLVPKGSGAGAMAGLQPMNAQPAQQASSVFTATHGFNPLGSNIHGPGSASNGFVSTIPIYSAGGDAHMPAGTSNLATAQAIGQWQAQLFGGMAPQMPGLGPAQMPGQSPMQPQAQMGQQPGMPQAPAIDWSRPVYRNARTGELSNTSYATDASGAFRGGLPMLHPGTGITAAGIRALSGNTGQAPAPAPAAPPPAPAEVGTTIDGDRPIYDPNFIQRLVNQQAASARLDPREVMKGFDIPGLSRDEGQYAASIPQMTASRAASNRAMAEIPLQAELANRMYRLAGQEGRGQEALSLANVLRMMQGTQDDERNSLLSAALDPLLALLTR